MDGRRKSLASDLLLSKKKEKARLLWWFRYLLSVSVKWTVYTYSKNGVQQRDNGSWWKKTSWLGSVIVYTTHFIRAGLVFPAPVPILPVLGLPFQKVRARVRFWSGTGEIWYGKVIYTVKFYPSRATFFGTPTFFIRVVPKISCSVNGP